MEMNAGYTRRECLTLLSAAVLPQARVEPGAAAAATGSGKPMRGAFMILATPYTNGGAVDWDDLVREVQFCHQCGVQGKDTAEMIAYARRAEALAPDALIAMPPSGATSLDEYGEYFRALAKVTSRPVIVQTTGGAPKLTPPVDFIVDLARELPNFGYVKEESEPLVERMKAEVQRRPPMKAIFGASFGTNWLYEMRLGLDGVITGNAMYADLMARMWDLHQQRHAEQLRDAFGKFLLMRNLSERIPGTDLYIMRKRGVFKTTVTRASAAPGSAAGSTWSLRALSFSPDDIAEIEYRFDALKPYLSAPSAI